MPKSQTINVDKLSKMCAMKLLGQRACACSICAKISGCWYNWDVLYNMQLDLLGPVLDVL